MKRNIVCNSYKDPLEAAMHSPYLVPIPEVAARGNVSGIIK